MALQKYPHRLILENRLEALAQINPWLERGWNEYELPNESLFEVALCIYEATANIIMYAYQVPDGYSKAPEPIARVIEISLILHDDAIEIKIQDDGYDFNPLMTPERKVAQTISEASLSGRGIPLLRGFSDKLSYQRSGGYNQLSIIKSLKVRVASPQ